MPRKPVHRKKPSTSLERAFSAGCEARMMGIPISKNPNPGGTNEHAYWRQGWKEIDENFGRDRPAHWPAESRPGIVASAS